MSVEVEISQSFGEKLRNMIPVKFASISLSCKKSASKPPPKSKAKHFPQNPPTKITKIFFFGLGDEPPEKFIYPNGFFPPRRGCGINLFPPTTPPVDRPQVRVRCQASPPRLRWSTGAMWPQRGDATGELMDLRSKRKPNSFFWGKFYKESLEPKSNFATFWGKEFFGKLLIWGFDVYIYKYK